MERASLSVEWLEEARLVRKWTQADVAEKLGVEVTTVRRWESGRCKPQPIKYRQLEELFGRVPQTEASPDAERLEGEQALQVAPMRPVVIETPQSQLVVIDTYTRFVAWDLGARLDRIARMWPFCRGNARYHELQTLLSREIELKDNMTMPENLINRRNALRRLASVPIELWGLTLTVPARLNPFPFDDILHQCAAGITALWYLHRGKDLLFVDSAVSRYIPTLEEMVKTSKGIQHQEATSILAQSLLLKGQSVRHLQANHTISLRYMQQAETVSEQAGNKALSIAAMRAQAVTYDYADNWQQAMQAAMKAKHRIETAVEETSIPPMLQSYVYAGLANYQAHNGQKYKQDALTSLGQAQSALDGAKDEPVPVWIDPSGSTLLLNSGLAYYHLGDAQQAIDTFAKINQLPESTAKINRIESLIDQVMVEVTREDKPRDMDFCIARWKQGIQGAIALRSEQRYAEAKNAYAAMRGAWPTEKRVKALSEYMKHW